MHVYVNSVPAVKPFDAIKSKGITLVPVGGSPHTEKTFTIVSKRTIEPVYTRLKV